MVLFPIMHIAILLLLVALHCAHRLQVEKPTLFRRTTSLELRAPDVESASEHLQREALESLLLAMKAPSRRVALSLIGSLAALPHRGTAAIALKPYEKDERFSLGLPEGLAGYKGKTETSIFSAIDMKTFASESITVQPLTQILEDDAQARSLPNLPATPLVADNIKSLSDLGSAEDTARMLLRLRDTGGGGRTGASKLLSWEATDSGLRFEFSTPLVVMDPDALEKQEGVRELNRHGVASAVFVGSNTSEEPKVVTIWGSAKDKIWAFKGPEITASIQSFVWKGSQSAK